MTDRKPLPPYATRARVVCDALWVRCGRRGWAYLKANPDCGELVWPAEEPPDAHEWRFVKGLHVYVVAGLTPMASVLLLVEELLGHGATSVDVIDWDLIGSGVRGLVAYA